MDKNSFNLLYTDAINALNQNHLLDALNCMRGMLSDTDSIELSNELEAIRQDYSMMLSFMQQGGTDPQRAAIYRHLTKRSYALTDKAARQYHLRHEKDFYTEICNRCRADGATTPDMLMDNIDLLQEKRAEGQADTGEIRTLYDTLDRLFESLWTAPLLNASDTERLRMFIERQTNDIQAPLLSALMLSAQRYFDPQKFLLLLHFCRTENTVVRARAMTATVWLYMQHEQRFNCYTDLSDGLALLAQDEQLKGELILLQRQLLLSMETAKAEKKLQNEILPDLLKNSNYQRNKMGMEQMEEDLAQALRGEPNAEWENMQGNKQLADNMKAIISMGKEGIDINLGTFSALKGFAFFQSISHWFAPFDEQRPEVESLFPKELKVNPIQMLMESGSFCDSDKYSLCLMLTQIMPSQRETMLTQIGAQIDSNEEQIREAAKANQNTAYVYRSYLQDLYRFYKLFSRKHQFDDPFKRDMLFTRYPVLSGMLKSNVYLKDMASYLIKRECYLDAISYIEEILKKEKADAELLQKIAFCYQHTDNLSKAIYYYQQADLLSPDNEWILRQMYLCFSACGRYEQELSCLKKLESMNPDNARLISESGLCLMQLGRYEEAANRFYELEYKGERVLSSWRAIAWCNFKMNKLEHAGKYYKKILQQEKVTWEDYLNAGHTAWCMGRTNEAILYYRQYVKLYENKKKDSALSPLLPFDDDREELLRHGIAPLDINLMRDMLLPDEKD